MALPKKTKESKPARKRADKSTVIESVIKAGSDAAATHDEKPKAARRGRKPAADKLETVAAPGEPKRRRIKTAENGKPPAPPKKAGRPKGKSFQPDDLLMDDHLAPDDEEDAIAEPDELDPLGIPIELLDPELRDASKSAAAQKAKPRQSKAERRMVQCAHCGGRFTWLSVERLCFTCVKKKLAQRKRDDESYSGIADTSDDDDDNS